MEQIESMTGTRQGAGGVPSPSMRNGALPPLSSPNSHRKEKSVLWRKGLNFPEKIKKVTINNYIKSWKADVKYYEVSKVYEKSNGTVDRVQRRC